MLYRAWQTKPADPSAEQTLRAAGYGPLLSRVLAARGVQDPAAAAHLLDGRDELTDPFLMRDMDKAVARIQQAVDAGERIVIFGDYDVDGVSATAILFECLQNLGALVRCKLPSRDGGGYGLNADTVRALAEKGYTLIITVDNGIAAVQEAALARSLGVDLVITDHHLPGDTLPEAAAVVDPNRADDTSPCKQLCGAGVAFKLCAALEGCPPEELLAVFGELAALGTIADVMPLVGENRTIVREGLAMLADSNRPGLQARGLELSYGPAALAAIVNATSTRFGARELRRTIRKTLEDPVAEALISGKLGGGQTVALEADAEGKPRLVLPE